MQQTTRDSMYNTSHHFSVGDLVWAIDDTYIVQCRVYKLIIEVDPDEIETIVERKIYHLDSVNDFGGKIMLKSDQLVFETLTDALSYKSDPDHTSTFTNTHNVVYDYTIDNTCWIVDNQTSLKSTIVQITIIPGLSGTIVYYHVLPENGGDYSTLIREQRYVFVTQEQANQYIHDCTLELTLTPTPQPVVTPTPSVMTV